MPKTMVVSGLKVWAVPGVRTWAVMLGGLIVAGALSLSAANSPMIGMVSSGAGQAGVVIDGARVSSNATLFDGSEVSSAVYARLQLNSGTRVDLGANSVMRIYSNHASLEVGASEVQGTGYSIDARSLKIQPTEAGSVARVRLDGTQRVLVAALTAPVNVLNSEGILVARVLPEMPMSFLPQAGSSTSFSNSGCVLNKSGAAVLVDQTGNQVFELRSKVKTVDLRKFVGQRATVTGSVDTSAKPAAGASQVVSVATVTAAPGASCSDVATRIGATTTAAGLAAGGAAVAGAAVGGAAVGAAAGGAAAAGVTAGVVGGVVAAAAGAAVVGGLAASGTFSSNY